MQGYQITFYTQQSRMHGHKTVAQWIMEQAHKLGVRGATLTASSQGFGHDGQQHSARFFDLADEPVELTLALAQSEADQLFALLRVEKLQVFYTRCAIEFGVSGLDD